LDGTVDTEKVGVDVSPGMIGAPGTPAPRSTMPGATTIQIAIKDAAEVRDMLPPVRVRLLATCRNANNLPDSHQPTISLRLVRRQLSRAHQLRGE
jgi:hypothetical protein